MKNSSILFQLLVIIASNLSITISFIPIFLKIRTTYKPSIFSLYEATTSLIERSRRPKQVGIPRKRMELPFAVLLMRSSYAIVDELDFTPMDEFQKAFFLYRQNEWQEYKNQHPAVMQGDLADPVYFDFISFCQYAVIADSMRNGKFEFMEKVGAEGNTTVVHRDSKYMSNAILPTIHSEKLGDAIIDYMYEKYPVSILPNFNNKHRSANPTTATTTATTQRISDTDTASSSSPFENSDSKASAELIHQFLIDAQLILDIFSFNSYALNMKIALRPDNSKNSNKSNNNNIKSSISSSGSSTGSNNESMVSGMLAEITMQVPVNLWSQQVLSLRQDQPVNHFDIKALQALCRRYNSNNNSSNNSGKSNDSNNSNSSNNNDDGDYRLCLEYMSTSVRNEIDVTHLVHIATYHHNHQ